MTEHIATSSAASSRSFSRVELPHLGKTVFRMGVAGAYGIGSSDIRWAAEQGVNYWVLEWWHGKVTEGIREVIRQDRERHVVSVLGVALTGWQVRRSVENALRKLGTEYLDVFKLAWLGRTAFYSDAVIETLLKLKQEGKVSAIGCSTHDRKRAGRLALDSAIDLFMIRYNAKHPGAEQDIFPHLSKRNPALISYTATSWGQLIRPAEGIVMPPWPGPGNPGCPPLSPELCYRFVLSNPHVHVVLTGPKDREQLRQNLQAVGQGPLQPEEMDWIRRYGALLRQGQK